MEPREDKGVFFGMYALVVVETKGKVGLGLWRSFFVGSFVVRSLEGRRTTKVR